MIKKIIILCVFIISISIQVFAQQSPYAPVIKGGELLFLLPNEVDKQLEALGNEKPNTLSKMLDKGMLLFAKAMYTNEEKIAVEAHEYLDEIYQNNEKLKNPVMLVYVGAAYSFIGGAIKKPLPTKKIKLANEGVAIIDRAIKQLETKKDNHGLGFAYYVRARTTSSFPKFLKESETTIKSLKTAAYYYKKAKLGNSSENEIVAQLYNVYAQYYLNQGDIAKAKKYLKAALEKTKNAQYSKYITYKLEELS